MAKIVYAVAGEGFGHSSRSQLIGKRFLDAGHEVVFAGSMKSLEYLKEYFGDRVHPVFGLSFVHDEGKINHFKTVIHNVGGFFEKNRVNRKLFKEIYKPFKPDLVITDFEPFSAWWAWRHGVPFISIDHEHLLTHYNVESKRKDWYPRFAAWVVTRFYYFGAFSYVVINFFKERVRSRNAVLAPPVLRSVIRQIRSSDGGHIVFYVTNGKNPDKLVNVFSAFTDRQFYIYGFNKYEERGNCIFKERSTEGFLKDLASSRGVIATAGFSLISECLYFRKRMLLLPVSGQFEQITNAHYVEKLDLGMSVNELTRENVNQFLEMVDKPMPDNEQILWPDNKKFFEKLQGVLNKLPVPINIS